MKTIHVHSAKTCFKAILSLSLLIVGLSGLSFGQSETPQRGFHPAGSYALTELETINTVNGNLMYRVPLASLPSGRGGHPGAKVGLFYNSKLYDTRTEFRQDPYQFGQVALGVLITSPEGGWRYGLQYQMQLENRLDQYWGGVTPQCPSTDAFQIYKLKISFPDGSIREFRPYGYTDSGGDGFFQARPDGWVQNCTFPNLGYWTYGTMTYFSTDGTHLRLDVQHDDETGQWWNNPWTLYLPDGSRVTNNESGASGQRIYDRNNNYVELRGATYNGHPANEIIDQLGRSIIEYGSGTNQDTVHETGFNNQTLDWVIKWKTIYVLKGYRPAPGYPDFDRLLDVSLYMVDEVALPTQSGGLSYRFGYNGSLTDNYPTHTSGWGELSSLTLPAQSQETIPAQATYQYYNDGQDNLYFYTALQNHASQRSLSYKLEYDGSSSQTTEVTEYKAAGYGNCGQSLSCSEVKGPDNGVTKEYITNSGNWERHLVYKTVRPDGTVIERIWQRNIPYSVSTTQVVNPYVKTEFTSVPDAAGNLTKTSIKDYNYDKNGNVTQVVEYDWVAYSSVTRSSDVYNRPTGIPSGATIKRVTINTYYNPTPDASDTTTDDTDAYHKSTSPNIKGALASSEVRSGVSGPTVSRTEMTYDNTATTGNLTVQRSWDSTKGALSNPLTTSNSVAVTNSYSNWATGITGRLETTVDANGNYTRLTYGDIGNGTTNLYVTQTVTGDNAAGNSSVKRTMQAKYDFSTGLTTEAKDADNNTTVRTTYDVFGRPTLVEDLAGTTVIRKATTEYSDTQRRVIVRRDKDTLGDLKLVQIQHYDQLGRVRLTRTLEDSATQSATDETTGVKVQTRYFSGSTTYPNGYQLTSNPYRAATSSAASSELGMGWSRVKRDQGGRPIEAETFGAALPKPWNPSSTSPSTGLVKTAYDANRVLVTDQAGRQRISETNALGQLVNVWEVTASDASTVSVTFPGYSSITAGYLTSYQYDTLSNLAQVTQTGNSGATTQNRYFLYSSLGRLIRARNPEQDVNSSLATSNPSGNNDWSLGYTYDNNGNLLTKTDANNTTTTYTYDALNRVTTISYSDGTPTVNRYYDGATYGKGRFWYDTVLNANGSHTSVDSYDALGRPLQMRQHFVTPTLMSGGAVWLGYNWSHAFYVTQSYNLAGQVTTLINPMGHTANYAYNAAGQLDTFGGSLGDGTSRNYVAYSTYTPAGQLTQEKFSTTTNIYHNIHYNNRQQITDIRVGSNADGMGTEWTWNRGALRFYFDSAAAGGPGGDNNGNLYRQDHFMPGTDTVSQWSMSISYYGYDSLNRITGVWENQQTQSTGESTAFTQQYTYDRWGNRRINVAATTNLAGITRQDFKAVAASNRLKAPTDTDTDATSDKLRYDKMGNLTKDIYTQNNYSNSTGQGTRVYDAENRIKEAYDGSGNLFARYTYNGDGKRVRRRITSGSTTTETWQIYGFGGELLAEYDYNSTAPSITYQKAYGYRGGQLLITATSGGELKWLVTDHLGSPRMVLDKSGSLTDNSGTTGINEGVVRHDYLPFGEELGYGIGVRTTSLGFVSQIAGLTPPTQPDDKVRQKFTSYERDQETGLDFAQARYYASVQGRFTSVDPLQESAKLENPQSWNRYSYVLNNPLIFIDPTGLLWIASGDANNPYRWVDECPNGGTCYQSVAVAINTGVAVYGSKNKSDIRLYASNENGVVFVTGLAGHPDAKFNSVAGNQRHPEHYLSPEAAAALFNAARDYAAAYPGDSNIVFTAGSAETGNPALNERGRAIHRSHQNGQNIDMRYMGTNGRPLVGNTASANADVDRMETLFDAFADQRAGLGAALTGTPERFGFGPISPGLQRIHRNHFHLQRNYPRPPQPARRR